MTKCYFNNRKLSLIFWGKKKKNATKHILNLFGNNVSYFSHLICTRGHHPLSYLLFLGKPLFYNSKIWKITISSQNTERLWRDNQAWHISWQGQKCFSKKMWKCKKKPVFKACCHIQFQHEFPHCDTYRTKFASYWYLYISLL